MTVLEALTASFSDQYLCPPIFVGKYKKSIILFFSQSLINYSRSQYILIQFFLGGVGSP